ncbi:hypothetical protein TRIATDRAFT_92582 [Trichoderma atroviride IMI 206040]|uniref:Uncharacterized protein n=1 Tax=Hypocrea atroviridis (strain ATCC 20476 / IMI 206040) TaxID=452589 RepID=G9NIC0_HYPAI|nr:uncharacterized protein TRIATDRAFT_92582 [Trichoderma atroviride IMI 206040]EHK49533.1 hypothetical protein TRIATDRAFT_92582 [Trichoderma atroviride IMI 206040]
MAEQSRVTDTRVASSSGARHMPIQYTDGPSPGEKSLAAPSRRYLILAASLAVRHRLCYLAARQTLLQAWLQRRWSSPLERPMAGNRDGRRSNQMCYTRPSRAKQRSTSIWAMVMVMVMVGSASLRSLGSLAWLQQPTCEVISYSIQSLFGCSSWTSDLTRWPPVFDQLNERGDAAPWPDRPLVRPIGLAAGNCRGKKSGCRFGSPDPVSIASRMQAETANRKQHYAPRSGVLDGNRGWPALPGAILRGAAAILPS